MLCITRYGSSHIEGLGSKKIEEKYKKYTENPPVANSLRKDVSFLTFNNAPKNYWWKVPTNKCWVIVIENEPGTSCVKF